MSITEAIKNHDLDKIKSLISSGQEVTMDHINDAAAREQLEILKYFVD